MLLQPFQPADKAQESSTLVQETRQRHVSRLLQTWENRVVIADLQSRLKWVGCGC